MKLLAISMLIFGLFFGMIAGVNLGVESAKSQYLDEGYTKGYIDATEGTRDPAFWHHITMKMHVVPDSGWCSITPGEGWTDKCR